MSEHKHPFVKYARYRPDMPDGNIASSKHFFDHMNKRRTVRHYSSEAVAREIIENCLKTAGTAPSGAHQQPWHFCAISNAAAKTTIRQAAEAEEQEFYSTKASAEWLRALEPLGTDTNKQFIETAPWVIAIFAKKYGIDENGNKVKHYYFNESVGLATGMLITALHNVGLSTLTHTPSPMGFLNQLCDRPKNEKPYMLLIVGYPQDECMVPDIARLPLDKISNFIE
ncbi:MAG: nitroreductase family protein [Rhizobiales bacterium]|nr:nitroreductase family protein [Hyphomicrobiales bacterium]NRB14454.1 nitroreductase family protein [Hyphomicrobiales bacterium]